MRLSVICCICFLLGSSCSGEGQVAKSPGLKVQTRTIAKDLMAPVSMAHAGDKSGRLFICEQTGRIKIIKNGKVLDKPFLDLGKWMDDIGKVYSEKGLLGL